MRKITLLTLMVLSIIEVLAQDIIVKNDKTEIKAKIEELTETTIKYKKFEMLDGPSYNINKRDVFMVIYKNGMKEYIESSESPAPTVSQNRPSQNIDNNKNSSQGSNRSNSNNNLSQNNQLQPFGDLIEVKAKQHYYKGKIITKWSQFDDIFAENNAAESLVYMGKRKMYYLTGTIVGGVGSIGTLYSTFSGRLFTPIGIASMVLFYTGITYSLKSLKQVPKAVESFNNSIQNKNSVSFKPLIKSDKLGSHFGVSIGF